MAGSTDIGLERLVAPHGDSGNCAQSGGRNHRSADVASIAGGDDPVLTNENVNCVCRQVKVYWPVVAF
jgi:hypothetical protein